MCVWVREGNSAVAYITAFCLQLNVSLDFKTWIIKYADPQINPLLLHLKKKKFCLFLV